MFGLTTTRRLNAELAAAKAETDRQRERAEKAEKAQATAEFNRQQVLKQNAELNAANRSLERRLLEPAPLSDDDRTAIERWEDRAKAHDAWTAPADLEKRPVDGASGRPLHPAVELRRALDRCLALEARLTTAEGRRGVRT